MSVLIVNSQMKSDLVFLEDPEVLVGLRWREILRGNQKDDHVQTLRTNITKTGIIF